MITHNRYQVYRYPTSAADHRTAVAGLAITFLAIAVLAIGYLTYMIAQNSGGIRLSSDSMAGQSMPQAKTGSLSAPVFINSALLR